MASASFVQAATALYLPLITPQLFGVLIAAVLSGVFFTQLAAFYTSHASRTRLDQIVVAVMAVTVVGELAVEWACLYELLVANGGNVLYPMIWHVPDFLMPLFSNAGSVASQIWFAERAWRVLGKNSWYLAATGALISVSFAASTSVSVIGLWSGGIKPEYYETLHRLMLVWLFAEGLADILTTSVLCIKARGVVLKANATGSQLATPLQRVIRLSFATSSVTSSTALIAGVTYITTHTYSAAWFPFVLSLPRLAALSCLITINLRSQWNVRASSNRSSVAICHPAFHSGDEEFKIDYPDRSEGSMVAVLDRSPVVSTVFHLPDLASKRVGRGPYLSELGSDGDLDRALRDFGKSDLKGLSPTLVPVPTPAEMEEGDCEQFFANRRPSNHSRRSSSHSGVLVDHQIKVQVEHVRPIDISED